jgi:hypothetical protein
VEEAIHHSLMKYPESHAATTLQCDLITAVSTVYNGVFISGLGGETWRVSTRCQLRLKRMAGGGTVLPRTMVVTGRDRWHQGFAPFFCTCALCAVSSEYLGGTKLTEDFRTVAAEERK